MRQRENLISILRPNQSLGGSGSETTGRWGSNSSTEVQMDRHHPVSSAPHSSCITGSFHMNNTFNNHHKETEQWEVAISSSLFLYVDIKSYCLGSITFALTCPHIRTDNIYWIGPQESFCFQKEALLWRGCEDAALTGKWQIRGFFCFFFKKRSTIDSQHFRLNTFGHCQIKVYLSFRRIERSVLFAPRALSIFHSFFLDISWIQQLC